MRHSPLLRLHLERVVLDGVTLSAAEQPRFRAALAAELSRLFSAEPIDAWRGGARARLDGGAVQLAVGGSAETWANQVAQSLFSTLRTDSQFSAASVSVEAARGAADESRPRSELNTTNQNNRKK